MGGWTMSRCGSARHVATSQPCVLAGVEETASVHWCTGGGACLRDVACLHVEGAVVRLLHFDDAGQVQQRRRIPRGCALRLRISNDARHCLGEIASPEQRKPGL